MVKGIDGRWPPGSRQLRGGACLGVGAGSGTEQVGGAVEPCHARRVAIEGRHRRLRRVDRRAGMGSAADGTAAIMRAGLAGLVGLAGVPAIGARICTITAIRTIGRNFRNRRRINEPSSTS